MTTKRPQTPRKRRTKTPARKPRPLRDPSETIPEIARTYATNIAKRMWPALYVKAVEAAPTVTRAMQTLV